jgi:two-component system nitrogen regulation response regulator NtrX
MTMQNLRLENSSLKKHVKIQGEEIIGISQPVQHMRELIRQAAPSDARILITGENGTGKELAARAIHRLSDRSGKPFVEVNCAAIPDTLIESELFGHEKGAFTDAVSSRRGRFEMANGGTIFLDEIGDMSLSAQAKVLRVIQEQKLERVGGEKTIEVDVRIVAATNKNLEAACEKGLFRRDLYFRLNVIPLYIPALRERQDDIPILLLHFLREMDAGNIEMEDDAIPFLCSYEWPGNIRELRNLAERIVVMHTGDRIGAAALKNLVQKKTEIFEKNRNLGLQGDGQMPAFQDILSMSYNEAKELFEKQYLEFQLARNEGVISRTAEAIGIYPSNLHAKLRKYGIRTER